MTRIGIDMGGTKIEAVCLDDDGVVIARKRIPTPREYDGTLTAITALVQQIEDDTGQSGTVGIGIPGVVTPSTGLVKNANSTWLNGQSLLADLEMRLSRPVRVMNDANCFAISEAADGAAAGADVVFGVILGTGVGGGIVVRGQVIEGPNLISGEWGHNPLPWMTPDEYPGAACYCGKNGCIESFLSGPGFERDFSQETGLHLRSRAIVEAAGHDPQATNAVLRYHDRLARALASLINLLDPSVIVLGGGMSNLPGLVESVFAILPRYVFSDSVNTRVVLNAHGDSSGVRGAAWLWPVEARESTPMTEKG
ncbi:MAG: ROK family protein [Gemmatimonadaceae bacterium]